MPLVGSKREIVSWLPAIGGAQWYGTNTVSGRMVRTTRAASTVVPRRVVTRTASPSLMPSVAAVSGCTSTHGAGDWSVRYPRRRVWLPDR